jgi:hypothetical protein
MVAIFLKLLFEQGEAGPFCVLPLVSIKQRFDRFESAQLAAEQPESDDGGAEE